MFDGTRRKCVRAYGLNRLRKMIILPPCVISRNELEWLFRGLESGRMGYASVHGRMGILGRGENSILKSS